MKVWVTNESSSFARGFDAWCDGTGEHELVNSLRNDELDYFRQDSIFRSQEIDLFDPTLPTMISRSGAEIIIHQLPITPELAYEHKDYALRHNIEGSHYVIEAAKEVNIPIIFVTSRHINKTKISNSFHNETISDLYNITAKTVESLLDLEYPNHTSIIPPIIYGPEFDSGISGLIKTAINGDDVVINLDPDMSHPFMHASDFFDALSLVVNGFKPEYSYIEITPDPKDYTSLDVIITELENNNLFLSYEIHPDKDLILDDQRVSDHISEYFNWEPKFPIEDGLEDVITKIREQHDNKGTE
jgi:nucleoside-diphosphate-sugar epimerase